jgi:hypothetical protein
MPHNEMEKLLAARIDMSKVKKLTPAETELRERLNIPGLGPFEEVSPDLPPIERAPMFRKQTPLIGVGTDQARQIGQLYNLAPQLRGRAPSITSGYGPMYINDLLKAANSDDPEQRYLGKRFLEQQTPHNIQGSTSVGIDAPIGAVEVGEHMDNRDWIGTLAHELQHVLAIRGIEGKNKIGYINKNNPFEAIINMGIHDPTRRTGPQRTDDLAALEVFNQPRKK